MQSAGNMAIPAVYDTIHRASPQYLCDRFYLPATPKDMSLMERGGIPVFGIESRHSVHDFDVFGTSISYPVLFMNLVKHMAISGIPLRRREREEDAGNWPMVIVGGLADAAPEFMSAAVDCVYLGEVEDEPGNPGLGAVCGRIAEFKAAGDWQADRPGCYDELAREFNYLYFPRTMAFEYAYEDRGLPHPSRQVSGYRPVLDGMRVPFRVRKVHDLSQVSLLTEWPLLLADPGMGSGDVEAGRGCTAWCSFCKESLVRKPYRQEPVENTVGRARQIRLSQGSLEMSPFAPNMPVHTRKRELLGALLETVSDEADTSSLRIDDFNSDAQYALIQVTGGADSLTFGLEGNSQRIRDLVGKGCSDDDVLRAVGQAIRGGIRKIKLYMITNLPGEDPADVMRIVTLGQRLAALRESLGLPGVRIQFSWTPWLNEAQTPMQWFAPTPPDYTLQQAMDQLRDTGIAFKIGTKAQPWKLAFFQACQRASREVGEAILDVLEELGTASWGGFPRDMKERLDAGLARHGFRNGLDDIFGERFRGDLLGWEHIDTGVSRRLLWDVYRQMTEFLEGTDPDSYEAQFDERYHGNEWVAKCDQSCQGRKCGACGVQDLKLRKAYIRAADGERDYAAQPVRKLDQTTVACRLRVRLDRPETSRFISAESFPFIIRRAAYRAAEETGFPAIAKRTVALASAPWKYRDWTTGAEYAEFGITRPVTSDGAAEFLPAMAAHLSPWLRVAFPDIPRTFFQVLPAEAKMPRGPSLWELEVSEHPDAAVAAIRAWGNAAEVPVLVRSESFYAGVQTEPGNAKDHVGDFWLVRDGHRYLLRMVLTGKVGPYQAAAALLRKASWIDVARHTARRVEFFDNADPLGGSLFRPACTACGRGIPASLLGELFDGDYCPRCRDEAAGTLVSGLARAGV